MGALSPLGGGGKIVEADETYYGHVEKRRAVDAAHGRPTSSAARARQ